MKGFIFLLFISFATLSVTAQKVTVTADKQKILIGEPFHLRLQANFNKGEPLDFFEVDSVLRFEILDKSEIDTSNFSDGVALLQNLTLTSWDSGKIHIAPFVLGAYQTKPLMIDVAYSPHPFDTTKPYHDIHDILDVKRPIESTWYWYLIGLLVLILLFLLFFPKGKPKAKGEFVSDEGAYKRALKKLDALQKRTDADGKIFYTELVQIFREYLHKRKNIYSFSKTTDDLSTQIEKLNMDKDQYQQLVQTLLLSDFVKYAKYQSSSGERRNSAESIRESIVAIENAHIPNPKPQTSNL
ncbi:MAG: hypothetical protein J7502_01065 [Flavisolibacter sp.]|nr:hypothetical protein [Flavisolibacter sp.]